MTPLHVSACIDLARKQTSEEVYFPIFLFLNRFPTDPELIPTIPTVFNIPTQRRHLRYSESTAGLLVVIQRSHVFPIRQIQAHFFNNQHQNTRQRRKFKPIFCLQGDSAGHYIHKLHATWGEEGYILSSLNALV